MVPTKKHLYPRHPARMQTMITLTPIAADTPGVRFGWLEAERVVFVTFIGTVIFVLVVLGVAV
jgi:hypothetical protein